MTLDFEEFVSVIARNPVKEEILQVSAMYAFRVWAATDEPPITLFFRKIVAQQCPMPWRVSHKHRYMYKYPNSSTLPVESGKATGLDSESQRD